MANKRYGVIRGRMMRATKTDSCGRTTYADAQTLVTKGFISVAVTSNIDEGEAIEVRNANGDICIDDTPAPKVRNFGLEWTFCDVDPELYAMLTNQSVVYDVNGDAVGFTVNSDVTAGDAGVVLELWSGVPADECAPGATGSWGYTMFPRLQGGTFGDFTLENGAVNFTITGAITKNGNSWGTGPYLVVGDVNNDPTVLETALLPNDHMLQRLVTIPPPTETGGLVPLLDPLTSTTVTNLTNGGTGLNASLTLVPVITPSTEPFWIDWGDGSYTYYTSGTAPHLHTYDAAGTYTVTIWTGAGSYSEDLTVA
jgi:hypothetical protein